MTPNAFAAAAKGGGEEHKPLPKAGEKCWIGDDTYFIYSFDKKPKLGTAILKIQAFDKAGKQDTTMEIRGDTDMPSMRGAHYSGPQLFKLNKKGDYLLPVNIVMPGEWEVNLHFFKDKKVIFMGSFRFNV